MSLAAEAATSAVAVATAATAVSLWRGADRHTGPVRHAYWLFALATVLLGLGAIGQLMLAAPASTAFPLTLADLPGLLALPVMAAGVASLGSRRGETRHPLAQRRGRAGTALAYLAVLGGVLPLAVAAGRRGLAPFAALLAVTISDVLVVGVRVNGYPVGASQGVLIAGFAALACAPWVGSRGWAGPREGGQFSRAVLHATTALAALAAAVAALVVVAWALAG